jgi:hypothetical protein
VEWITADGQKTIRNSVVETCSVAEAYDRCCPRSKDQEPVSAAAYDKSENKDRLDTANKDADNAAYAVSHDQAAGATKVPEAKAPYPSAPQSSEALAQTSAETCTEGTDKMLNQNISPHRGLFFYIHRPRTTTKKPVLAPLLQSATLKSILRNRTVLEFPTIYALPDPAETLLADRENSPFILEEEYLRTAGPEEMQQSSAASDDENVIAETQTFPDSSINLQNVDESKVLEVLKQDLFEPVPDTGSVE